MRRAEIVRWLGALALAAVTATEGCGAKRPGSSSMDRRREVLGREEILSSPVRDRDLYEVLRSLRPEYLATVSRGRTLTTPLDVYVDRVRQQGVGSLQSIRASSVETVEYLDPTHALAEYGPRAAGGALRVTLYRPKDPPEEL